MKYKEEFSTLLNKLAIFYFICVGFPYEEFLLSPLLNNTEKHSKKIDSQNF